MNIKMRDAIASLAPDAEWVLRGDDLEWLSLNIPQPTQSELETELTKLQAEHDSTEYQRLRATEYPPIGDQLDALFHAGVFPADMAAQLQAVKDKYPR